MNSVYTNIIPHKIRRFNPIGAHETVTPYSVTEIVEIFEKVNGVAVNHIWSQGVTENFRVCPFIKKNF